MVLAVRRAEGKTLITSERPAARVLEYGIGKPHKAERPVIEWKQFIYSMQLGIVAQFFKEYTKPK